MTLSSVSLITGVSMGMEYVQAMPEESIDKSIIVDLLFFRFIFTLQ